MHFEPTMMLRHALLTAALCTGSVATASAQRPFPPIDTNFIGQTVHVPQSPIQSQIVFQEGVTTVETHDNRSGLARGGHDFISYVAINGSSDHGYVVVNHELRDTSSLFGDGGGMTVVEMRRENGAWSAVGPYRNVDFSAVRATWNNCGGALTPWGDVLTAEEFGPSSNAQVFNSGKGIRDTSDVTITFNGQSRTIRAYENLGWMVQIDPANATAVRKLWKMGRYSHEGAWCLPDGKTVYLTDDSSPAFLYKFVADVANDYTEGQLYVYKQSADAAGGEWLPLPMDFDSLANVTSVAMNRGATAFIRLEWPTWHNGKLYITETGRDDFDWKSARTKGAVPARHLEEFHHGLDSTYIDVYGRILEFDPATNRLRPFLEGGWAAKDRTIHLSNPDGLSTIVIKGKTYFMIQEDLNGESYGRVNLDAQRVERTICEAYLLDASIENPTLDDLTRFFVSSAGAELTGAVATPDGSTVFINNQHPSRSNPAPYNTAATFALTGFSALSNVPVFDGEGSTGSFRIWPNPATRELRFNRATDVAIYDARGERVLVSRNSDRVIISDLVPGTYFVQTLDNQVQKLVVE